MCRLMGMGACPHSHQAQSSNWGIFNQHIWGDYDQHSQIRNAPGAEGFAAAWEEAVDRGMARLEDCALERAIEGEERFIIRRGEVVASWRRYDTPLLMFLLRNRRRGRYDAYGVRGGERP
jgi:hypothetical protein